MTSDRFSLHRPHPWHGLPSGPGIPGLVDAFIEITPFDSVKYEIDKVTGYTRVDRPQRGASHPPTLYGFIPRTYCGPEVAALCPGALLGDSDPLDICVVSERPITRGEIVCRAKVLGGIQLLDRDEADDKIIAVLTTDAFWGTANDLTDLPPALVDRLQHYFRTYKWGLGGTDSRPAIQILGVYGRAHADRVIEAAISDYKAEFDT